MIKGHSADYSARLQEWDSELYRKVCREMGCRFDQANYQILNKFVKAYYGEDHEAIALAEGCNPSNGYPYHIIWHRRSTKNNSQ